ncbi:MAG: branched-chain amino acid ABC transporter permease, partial [Nostoc sp.]
VGDTWISGAFGVQSYRIPLSTEPNLFIRFLMIGLLTLLATVTFFTLWRWIRTTQISRTTDLGQRMTSKEEFGSRLGVGIVLAVLAAAIY